MLLGQFERLIRQQIETGCDSQLISKIAPATDKNIKEVVTIQLFLVRETLQSKKLARAKAAKKGKTL